MTATCWCCVKLILNSKHRFYYTHFPADCHTIWSLLVHAVYHSRHMKYETAYMYFILFLAAINFSSFVIWVLSFHKTDHFISIMNLFKLQGIWICTKFLHSKKPKCQNLEFYIKMTKFSKKFISHNIVL